MTEMIRISKNELKMKENCSTFKKTPSVKYCFFFYPNRTRLKKINLDKNLRAIQISLYSHLGLKKSLFRSS